MRGDPWKGQDALIVFRLYTCFHRLSSFRGVNKVVETIIPILPFPHGVLAPKKPPNLPPTIALSIPPHFNTY